MKLFRDYRFVLVFLAATSVCGFLVIRGLNQKQARHQEIREAFLVLNSTDHDQQTRRLYEWLIRELETIPDRTLLDDFQRFSALVEPAKPKPDSLVWKYYRSVANELEKRSRSTIVHALKLAEELP